MQKLLFVIRTYWFLFLFAFLYTATPAMAQAQASLSINPVTGTYKTGDLFSVLVQVHTDGKAINAASGDIRFSNQTLEVLSVGFSRSIFTIWTEEPTFSNTNEFVRFSGGVPSPGFKGDTGAIVRITFRAKQPGKTQVTFKSGTALANDGFGTNILSEFKSASFTISAATIKESKPEADFPHATASGLGERPLATPLITTWPERIEEGKILSIRGLGNPSGNVVVYFQHSSNKPDTEEIITGPDGRFSVTFSKPLQAGFYRVWAKNVDGELESASSEAVTVEVVKPLVFRIGDLAISYASVIVTLLALCILALLLLGWGWIKLRKFQENQGKEISEAEKALHRGFDKLKDGLSAYVDYLTDVRSTREAKKRGEMTQKELKEELIDIEKDIEKEIEDIPTKRK